MPPNREAGRCLVCTYTLTCTAQHALLPRARHRTAGPEPKGSTVIPEYLIIDEIKRKKQEKAWEPEPLHLPLYIPNWPPKKEDKEEQEPKDQGSHVIIIEM